MTDTLYELFKEIRDLKDTVEIIQRTAASQEHLFKVEAQVEGISKVLGRTTKELDMLYVRQYRGVVVRPEALPCSCNIKEEI